MYVLCVPRSISSEVHDFMTPAGAGVAIAHPARGPPASTAAAPRSSDGDLTDEDGLRLEDDEKELCAGVRACVLLGRGVAQCYPRRPSGHVQTP